MSNKIKSIFTNKEIIQKIQDKLPKLFQLAEIDNSRDGKLGMEVGSARERIIIAMLIYTFGQENINTNIPITEKETDVIIFDEPISIKTFTNKRVVGVKLIWSVDAEKALYFKTSYVPECDILLVHINWNAKGALYLIPKEAQLEVLNSMGRDKYFKLPVAGTNSRGVEITNIAINKLVINSLSKKIEIDWIRKENANYNQYDRWVDLWSEK